MYTRQVDLTGWPSSNPIDGGSIYFRGVAIFLTQTGHVDNYETTGVVNQ
jgi:hypothetical protein